MNKCQYLEPLDDLCGYPSEYRCAAVNVQGNEDSVLFSCADGEHLFQIIALLLTHGALSVSVSESD